MQISNSKNYFLTFFSSFGNVLINTLIGIISVPISLNYWGPEKYGVLALITSILIYLSLFSFGLGTSSGVLMAKNKQVWIKLKILKNTIRLLSLCTFFALVLFILLNIYNKEWIKILGNIPEIYFEETLKACFILGIFYFINLPFTLTQSVMNGFYINYIDNIFSSVQLILKFINLLLIIHFKGNLITFAILSGISDLLINLSKLVYLKIKLKSNFDELEAATENSIYQGNNDTHNKTIIISGLRFFSLGIIYLVVSASDNIIISKTLGMVAITSFSITLRLFSIMNSFIATINNSLMPVISREFSDSNWDRLNELYNNFLFISTSIAGLGWIGGIYFFKEIISIWAGMSGYAGNFTVFLMGLSLYLFSVINLSTCFVNSLNIVKGLYLVIFIEGILKIVIAIYLIKLYGIVGLAMASAISTILTTIWIYPYWIKKNTSYKVYMKHKILISHFLFLLLPITIIGLLLRINNVKTFLMVSCGVMFVFVYIILTYFFFPKKIKEMFTRKISKGLKKI